MADPVTLTARSSHLYPGARLALAGGPPAGDAALRCAVEFSDGALGLGELRLTGGGSAVLAVGAYRTAAGTMIEDKSWLLEVEETGETFRIVRRVK